MKAKRILVVDDEHCIADTLVAILRISGYDAIAAYNAENAMAECDSFNPELVITDVVMPGMNGVEMAILIRHRLPDCRILLISGHASSVDVLENARSQGYGFDILAKPVHPADLLSRLAA